MRRHGGDLIRGGGTASLIGGGRTRASSGTTGIELLDEAVPTFTLSLGMSVRREIEHECAEINWIARSQVGAPAESGGYLFAMYGPRSDGVKVVYASASGVEHTTGSVLLASPTDVKRDLGDDLKRAELRLVGNWHSHPDFIPRPSSVDLDNWGEHLRRSGLDSFASIIVTPSDSELGWSFPQLHAYRTSWDPGQPWGTKPVCTPARIVE
jgi:proteasome lid subunit RPN8/RPN11